MTAERRVAGFGWKPDLPDHRDQIFNLAERVSLGLSLPAQGGLTADQLPPIWNQGQLGSCTAHGSLRAYLAEAMKQGLQLPMLSRLMQYYDSRRLEGTTAYDAGAQVRDAIKALATYGCAPESEWPYDVSQFAVQPPDAVYADAAKHMAFKYQRIVLPGPGAPMRTALLSGHAIAFGFPVPRYFEDPSVWDPASGEPLPLPGPGDYFIGGHCVACVAYDFSCKFASGPAVSYRYPPFFECDNSWGAEWGQAGSFNLHFDWFDANRGLASDLWVISAVS